MVTVKDVPKKMHSTVIDTIPSPLLELMVREYEHIVTFSVLPSAYHQYVVKHLAGDPLCRVECNPDLVHWKNDYESCNLLFAVNYLTIDQVREMIDNYIVKKEERMYKSTIRERDRLFYGITLRDTDDMYPLDMRFPRYHPMMLCQDKNSWMDAFLVDESLHVAEMRLGDGTAPQRFIERYCLHPSTPVRNIWESYGSHNMFDVRFIGKYTQQIFQIDRLRSRYKNDMVLLFSSSQEVDTQGLCERMIEHNSKVRSVGEYVPLEIPLRYRVQVPIPVRYESSQVNAEIEQHRRTVKEADDKYVADQKEEVRAERRFEKRMLRKQAQMGVTTRQLDDFNTGKEKEITEVGDDIIDLEDRDDYTEYIKG